MRPDASMVEEENGRSTLVVAKLNVNHNLFTVPVTQAVQMIEAGLLGSPTEIKHKEFDWALRRVRHQTIDDSLFLSGVLVKARTKEVPKLTPEDMEHQSVQDYAHAWSRFLFYGDTELFVFEEKRNQIAISTFCHVMVRLIESSEPALQDLITIRPIPVEGEFLKLLLSAHIVTKVRFEVSPANGDSVRWDEIEREMVTTRATTMRREYVSSTNRGLAVAGSPIQSMCEYVDRGWASGAVTLLEKDGRETRHSSQDRIRRQRAEYHGLRELWSKMANLARTRRRK